MVQRHLREGDDRAEHTRHNGKTMRVEDRLLVVLVCAALTACAPRANLAPPTPAAAMAPGVGATGTIDTSGRFGKGFDANEAYSLLELCINANNLGEQGYTWQANDWTPIYPAAAADPAQVIGP